MNLFCLALSANKEFDDWCVLAFSELSSCDRLYVEGEASDFFIWIWYIYFEVALYGSLRNFI